MVEGLGRSTLTRFLTYTAPGAAGAVRLDAGVERRVDGARSAVASGTFATGPLGLSQGRDPQGRDQIRDQDATGRSGTAGTAATSTAWRARRIVTGETDQAVWDRVRLAHNPEVAGSNPAPATT